MPREPISKDIMHFEPPYCRIISHKSEMEWPLRGLTFSEESILVGRGSKF